MTFTIELRLPRSDNPNGGRGHWAKRARLRKEDRQLAFTEWRKALGTTPAPKWPAARMTCHWHARQIQHIPDEGNAHARLKAYTDALMDAGIIANDDRLKTAIEPVIDKRARVVLTITPASPQEE